MLINLSNHSSALWGKEQAQAAMQYGDIIDLPFPEVDANGSEAYIAALADEYVVKIQQLAGSQYAVVHLMGEMTFTFALLKRLQPLGYICIASTSERRVIELEAGHKDVLFHFVQFRRYE